MVEQVAGELAGKVKIVGVDVDQGGEAAANSGITSIPALVFFKGGKEVHRVVGYIKKPDLLKLIQQHLG